MAAALLLQALLVACATPKQPSVAVLPFDVVGGGASLGTRARRTLAEEVRRRGTARSLPDDAVDRAVARSAACAGNRRSSGCAVESGRTLGAQQVVTGAVAGLGQTVVIQLQLVEVGRAVVQQKVEETFFGGASAAAEALQPLALRLLGEPPVKPRGRRWYRRWWLWTAVGLAVAAVAVSVPLAVGRQSDSRESLRLP